MQSGRVLREGPRQLTIDERNAGQRIDNFLIGSLKDVPRARIYRILRRGEVRVNRGRIRQGYRLQRGDVVRIPPLVQREPPATAVPGEELMRTVARTIVYEDAELLVCDKPAGIPVHAGSGHRCGLIEALRALRPEVPRLELCHRLDRETSGCLLIAKNRACLGQLHGWLRTGALEKRYLLLVRGRWRGGARTVEAPLRKNVLRGGERMASTGRGGKPAVTVFEPVQTGPVASLLSARPLTGRTHQIRVHAAELGYPIAGDDKYGERGFNRRMRELGLQRLFLHACSITLPSALSGPGPRSGKGLRFDAPPGPELVRTLAAIGF